MTNRPNKASAGNGAVTPRFHASALSRAVPEMRRTAMSSLRHTRWFVLFMTSALILIWGTSLTHAIWGGINPGYERHRANHPYPVHAVFITCCIITVEFVLLFSILRPFSLSSPHRLWIALGIFAPLWIADFMFISGMPDQAGYCYSNGFFLFFADAFLVVATIISFVIFRRPPEIRTNEVV
jgi:hypothetical protein